MKIILAFISFSIIALSISPVNAQSDDNVKVPGKIEGTKNIQSDMSTNSAGDYESTKKDLMKKYGMTSEEVDKYIKQDKMNITDVYQAGELSKKTGKPVSEVMNSYVKNKNWEKTSQELGIKSDSELSPANTGSVNTAPVIKSTDDKIPSTNEIKKENVKQKDQPQVNDTNNSKSTK